MISVLNEHLKYPILAPYNGAQTISNHTRVYQVYQGKGFQSVICLTECLDAVFVCL